MWNQRPKLSNFVLILLLLQDSVSFLGADEDRMTSLPNQVNELKDLTEKTLKRVSLYFNKIQSKTFITRNIQIISKQRWQSTIKLWIILNEWFVNILKYIYMILGCQRWSRNDGASRQGCQHGCAGHHRAYQWYSTYSER